MLSTIIEENNRRLANIQQPYDPLEGSDPEIISRERCISDFEYWAARCCYIKNKQGGPDILFRLNRPQRKLVAALEKMRKEGKPIRLILLKARQWGGSTCIQLYMAWMQVMMKSGLNSLIIAHQHSATAEIRDMFIRMIEAYPEEMLATEPEQNQEKRKKGRSSGTRKLPKRISPAGPSAFRVNSGNFKVKVGSAERPDSCRGGDYSLVHCSEVAIWRKTRLRMPEDQMRSACSGVLLRPDTMIVMESTANGTGNFFHNEYEAAKRGESQFMPLFVAWFEIDQYSTPLTPEERELLAKQLWEGRKNETAENERSQPGAYLWWLWNRGATLEAIAWYIRERAKYSDHAQMASEYPSDDIEAFTHSGARVFDRYRVETFRHACTLPFEKGEITGGATSGPDCLKNLKFLKDSQGLLKIWKFPEKDPYIEIAHRYITVVDIGGRSLKADWSVIAVFDRAPLLEGRGIEVVAQWRGHSDFDLLAWNAARIAAFFDNSLLVVESNTLETRDHDRNVEGDQSHYLLSQIRKAYPHLYARKASPEDIRQGRPVKYGFHTNVATKPLVIANLIKVVREGLYVERDSLCLDEYLTYEQRQDGSYGALSGKHDDLLMTRAIGLHIALNEMPFPKKTVKSDQNGIRNRPGSYAAF